MTRPTAWDSHLAPLLDEPALAPFALNGALVVWSADGTSILHADDAGRALLSQTLGEEGLDRLRALAAAIAPSAGVRLERIALIEGQAALTTACRIIPALAGGHALLTLFRPARNRAMPTDAQPSAAAIPATDGGVSDATPQLPGRRRRCHARAICGSCGISMPMA
jgi:hypothetical protein